MKNYLRVLEDEAVFVLREAAASFERLVMLYSIGKDSSVLLHIAYKAFYPAPIPFPIMHIDTGYKFPEMYELREKMAKKYRVKLIIEKNEEWIKKGAHPDNIGKDMCCRYLKTNALLNALKKHGFNAAIGGARRDEEKSRAKERFFSFRDKFGQWDPRNQRPELWSIYNTRIFENESMRIFPLSNWTELDVWEYIREENIEVVPLYFAKEREVIEKNGVILPVQNKIGGNVKKILCRYRSLGCMPCTGAVVSDSDNLDKIIIELKTSKISERGNRLIDLTEDAAMEKKKKDGYF